MKPSGGVTVRLANDQPLISTLVLPAVAVKLCVPSVNIVPTGMLDTETASFSDPSLSVRLADEIEVRRRIAVADGEDPPPDAVVIVGCHVVVGPGDDEAAVRTCRDRRRMLVTVRIAVDGELVADRIAVRIDDPRLDLAVVAVAVFHVLPGHDDEAVGQLRELRGLLVLLALGIDLKLGADLVTAGVEDLELDVGIVRIGREFG